MSDMDIGHGVSVRVQGLWWTHHTPSGEACEASGYIPVRLPSEPGPERCWVLESSFPLTLSPSLLCNRCGTHGFIREGRWVPA